ncbi:MAG: S-layer homology domain-containing protein [Bryobacterales bacterium]|nr:S-layer homology domain-containing protein [Bryobacterales bacterium]
MQHWNRPSSGVPLACLGLLVFCHIAAAQGPCAYTLTPATINLPSSGGSGAIAVNTAPGCGWAVTSQPAWLFFPSADSGVGPAVLAYTAQPSFHPVSRIGTVTIAGQSVTLHQAGSCDWSLDPVQRSVAAAAATGQIQITLTSGTAGCQWQASSSAAWLRITGANSGSGTSSTLAYAVDPNAASSARTATLTISGRSVSITQAGAAAFCSPALSPGSALMENTGGNGSFHVISSCPWTATSSAPWISLANSAAGAGNGTVSYSVQPMPTGEPARTGTISVNSSLFRITQNAASCTFTVTGPSSLPASGVTDASLIVVPSSPNCAWSASTSADWVTITSGANGNVSGVVRYAVTPNPGPERTTSLVVAGSMVTLRQAAGTGCPATLAPDSVTFTADGTGSTGATVLVQSPCSWTATSNVSWIRIISPANGNGPGPVTYRVEPNATPAARSGSLTVAGKTLSITQNPPASCRISIGTESVTVAAAGASSAVPINASPGCNWSLARAGLPSWITAAQAAGTGNGTLRLNIEANTGATPRQAMLTVAERTITVTQPAGASFSCQASTPFYSPAMRAEGMAELTAELILDCQGMASQQIRGDIVVRLNTRLTSRAVNTSGGVEALLLVQEPAVAQLGTNAFTGTLVSNDAVRFPNVLIANAGMNYGRRFRIVNLRADATVPNLASDIFATVEIPGIPVSNPRQLVGQKQPGVAATINTPTAAAANVLLPVTFRELLPTAFRPRIAPGQDPSIPGHMYLYNAESGYVNLSLLGSRIGLADSGTRLMVRLRNLRPGVRVQAPVEPSNAPGAARLVSPDSTGAGLGFVSGTSPRDIPVSDGEAVITWEVIQATAGPETFTFPITILGTLPGDDSAIVSAATAFLGPVETAGGTSIPRFQEAVGARRPYALRIAGSLGEAASSAALRSPGTVRRAPAGNRSLALGVSVTNDSDGPTAATYIRGNLSAGLSVPADCDARDSRGTCHGGDGFALVTIPSLDPGQTIHLSFPAFLSDQAPGGSAIRLTATASSDFTVAADAADGCLAGFSEPSLEIAAGASSGTMRVYSCHPWTLDTSTTPWLTLSPSRGEGDTTITYTVTANPSASPRSAVLALTRTSALTLVQQGGSGNIAPCTYSFNSFQDSAAASGDIRTVRLSTGPACSWTALANAAWINILSARNGAGTSVIRYQVAPNTTNVPRMATVTAGGLAFSVTQAPANCTYTLSGPAALLPATAGSYPISVQTQGGCPWIATTSTPWVTFVTTGSAGSGSFTINVAANTGAVPRPGSLVVAGQTLRYLQRGSDSPVFHDTPASHPFLGYINYLGANGITNGCNNTATLYCPESLMTRSEMAAFIVRSLLGESFTYNPAPYFADVPASHTAFRYIQKLRDLGVTNGCTASTYCPDATVTRGQMAAFLVRALLGIDATATFPYPASAFFADVPGAHPFFAYIQKLRELGITAGCTAATYCSEDGNTRGQMAVFVTRGLSQ